MRIWAPPLQNHPDGGTTTDVVYLPERDTPAAILGLDAGLARSWSFNAPQRVENHGTLTLFLSIA